MLYYPDIKFQCALAKNIDNFYIKAVGQDGQIRYIVKQQEDIKDFKSYMNYLAFAMLQINRKWLYALKDPLYYDLYIAIDVHDKIAGFIFFYKNGEEIIFETHDAPSNTNQRSEKLTKELIARVIYNRLKKDIPHYELDPTSIILIRDGRTYTSEKAGFDAAIEKLKDNHIFNKGIVTGIAEVHKYSSISPRIVTEIEGFDQYENPQIGSYRILNKREGIVCNTGYPFKLRGTAKPLYITIFAGDLNIEWLLEDIFAQSLLAFAAPNKCSRNPIILKLLDDLLEPITAPVDEKIVKLGDEEDFIEEFEFQEN